jgi:hypothetical protein
MEANRDAVHVAKRRGLNWPQDAADNVVPFPVKPKPAYRVECSTTGWYHAAAISEEQLRPRRS